MNGFYRDFTSTTQPRSNATGPYASPLFDPSILHTPARVDSIHKGRIIRKKGIASTTYTYEYGDDDSGFQPVLFAKKSFCKIRIFAAGDKKTPIALIRSNIIGTEYILFERGRETYIVRFEIRIFNNYGPRKLTVFFTGHDDAGMKPLSQRVKDKRWDQVITLTNRLPEYNSVLETYILNFLGRVTEPSIKNFQLIHPMDIDNILLTFGKTDKDVFVVDFTHPFNAVEAFFFGICSLDMKLCWE